MDEPRQTRATIGATCNAEAWPGVDTESLSAAARVAFQNRVAAVTAYLGGEEVGQLCIRHDISRQFLYRLIRRCMLPHRDGRVWGFRALVPYQRCKRSYTRTTEVQAKRPGQRGGMAGALQQLFERYPTIRDLVVGYFLKRSATAAAHESRISYKSIHKRFLDAVREHGIEGYPFTAKKLGYDGLYRYLKQVELDHHREGVIARSGEAAARALETGGPQEPNVLIERPYRRVQFDGHNIDISFILAVPSLIGGETEVVVSRLWLLLVRDVASRAIIGHHIAFGEQYNKYDVLLCVKKAVTPWQPRQLTLPGLNYPKDGGFPSTEIKELQWATFGEFLYDNASSHLTEDVRRVISDACGCGVNAGAVAVPERRGIVEAVFRQFEEAGFHRLPSTLGSSPQDIRRNNPEQAARRFRISLAHVEDLVDVLIARLNGTPTAGLNYRSPLEQLKYFASDPDVFVPRLDAKDRRRLNMLNVRVVAKIRGRIADGKRPYVQYMGAVYTSQILASCPEFSGRGVVLYIDPEDARYAQAYLDDGSDIGQLEVKGMWRRTRHTLEMRKAVMQAKNRQLIHYTADDDPIHVYVDHLSTLAAKNKKATRALMKARRATEATQPTIAMNGAELLDGTMEEGARKEVGTPLPDGVFNQKAVVSG